MFKTSAWKVGSYFVKCEKCGSTDLLQDKPYERNLSYK